MTAVRSGSVPRQFPKPKVRGSSPLGTASKTVILSGPIPAALPRSATGLGAMGLLGWRTKRKAQAVAA